MVYFIKKMSASRKKYAPQILYIINLGYAWAKRICSANRKKALAKVEIVFTPATQVRMIENYIQKNYSYQFQICILEPALAGDCSNSSPIKQKDLSLKMKS